jgi:Transcription termination factor nusG
MGRPSPALIEATLERGVLWHVIYTKPQCERMVVEQLDARAIETFMPLRHPRRNSRIYAGWQPRPVFARYVFAAHPVDRHISELWNLRGEIIVLGGDLPLFVPAKVMIELFQRIDSNGYMSIPHLKPGDPVIVRREPFAELCGLLTRIGGKEALVWIQQMGAMVRVPADAIKAAS